MKWSESKKSVRKRPGLSADAADLECLVGEDDQVVSWKPREETVFQGSEVVKTGGKMSLRGLAFDSLAWR